MDGLLGILVPVILMKQQTLINPVFFQGVGVHTGRTVKMSVRPWKGGGILFRRLDLDGAEIEPGQAEIRAGHCSALAADKGGAQVQTIEHLMAALYMLGVDSALVELDGPEIPILDGSAKPMAEALDKAGKQSLDSERMVRKIIRPFRIEKGEALMEVEPDKNFRITYSIAFSHKAVGRQTLSLVLDAAAFLTEIAPARTFGFLRDRDELSKNGLARGAALENTVVLDEKGIVNGPLRFQDEFVRHKILDLIGDLALFGCHLIGHFSVKKGGHELHHILVKHLRNHPDLTSAG